jgi:YD repeat-containing protein
MRQVFPIAPSGSGWQWVFLVLLIALLGWLIFILLSPNKGSVELEDSVLRLRIPLYGRTIPFTQLNIPEARVVDLRDEKNLQLKWRTNGIGMPRYNVGWFRLYDGQKALAAVTNPRRVVYIPTRDGYSLLVSVTDPEGLLGALKASATGGAY